MAYQANSAGSLGKIADNNPVSEMAAEKNKLSFMCLLTRKGLYVLVVSVLFYSSPVSAGPYLDSAHGNTTYGVDRVRTSDFGYTQGHCAHCHEQHASIEGQALASPAPYHFALFYDDLAACQTLCTTCHYQSSTYQQVTNYPYAKNFGGSPQIWYGDIYTQFCSSNSLPAVCGSRHNLGQIRTVLISSVGQDWGFNDDPNPCVACHNPHADQQNHPVAIDGEGKLNTAIRRPSDYKSTDPLDMLWGDDANERMSSYASSVGGYYKAPYYTAGVTFEPANNSTSDGSNLPDYVTFCMDCHKYAQWDPERSASVKAIVWDYSHGLYPDIHGAAPANTLDAGVIITGCMATEGSLKAPYNTYEPNSSNYVLSCLDCHEPHGNYKRLHLIRLRINGEAVGPDSPICDAATDWPNICARCHNMSHTTGNCQGCHGTLDGFHGTTFECAAGIGGCVAGSWDTCPRSF